MTTTKRSTGQVKRHAIEGVTLVELMVTISIAAILLALGIPSFNNMIASNRLAAEHNNFVAVLRIARNEAVHRGARVTIRNTAGGGNWGDGWSMFVDTDGDGVKDPDPSDPVLRTGIALDSSLTLYADSNFANFISFLPAGPTNKAGDFALCYNDDPTRSRVIVINNTGRIRSGTDSNGDGTPETDAGNIASCTNP